MKDEKSYYSIGEAAKAAGMTEETLRHYDRVGLVKPSKRDEWTNYRYYTEQHVVRLNTVYALRQMELPLKKIKEVLAYDDLRKIVDFLTEAEQTADKKIAALQYSKSKIQAAKRDYARKLQTERRTEQAFVQRLPARVIMLSDEAEKPALDDLWNYLGRFYSQIEPSRREQFAFEDLAGLYTEGGRSRLFAVCLRHGEARGLITLPAGSYLCADCTEDERSETLCRLLRRAEADYGVSPRFTLQIIVISGILKWNYRLQVPLEADGGTP